MLAYCVLEAAADVTLSTLDADGVVHVDQAKNGGGETVARALNIVWRCFSSSLSAKICFSSVPRTLNRRVSHLEVALSAGRWPRRFQPFGSSFPRKLWSLDVAGNWKRRLRSARRKLLGANGAERRGKWGNDSRGHWNRCHRRKLRPGDTCFSYQET